MSEPEYDVDAADRQSATLDAGVAHLLVMNGGAAVALLAFLQASWIKDPDLAAIVLLPLFFFGLGTAASGVVNLLRYKASRLSTDCRETGSAKLKRDQERWSRCSQAIQCLAPGLFVLGILTLTIGASLALAGTRLLFTLIAELFLAIAGSVGFTCLILRLLSGLKKQ
jgi:hypothetical protein